MYDPFLENYAAEHFSETPVLYVGEGKKVLHPVDIVVFILVLLISVGIGIFYALHGERQRTTSEYFMGKRQLQVIPVSISMFMSYVSAILILGNAAEMYKYGIQMFLGVLGSSLANIVSAYLFVPLFHRLRLVSSFGYHELRYKKKYVKKLGTAMSIVSGLMYMGLATFAPATALEAVTTFPAWLAIIICGVVVTIYTTFGGMKAVVWTDVFQGFIYIIGILIILILGTNKVGGIAEVFRIAQENGRLNVFDTNFYTLDPTVRLTIWSVVFGRMFTSLFMALRQPTVQRYCSLASVKKAYAAVLLNIPCIALAYVLTCLMGLVVFSYYAKVGCDPLRAGFIKNSNQLLPYFVVNVLNIPGIPGLFLAVLYSGALSSISSSLNSLSAVTWKDFLELRFAHLSELRKTLITKFLVLLYGLISIGIAFLAMNLSGHVMMLVQSFLGSLGGPVQTMFMGIFIPCLNAVGVVTGAVFGVAFGMFMAIGGNIANYHRSYLPTIVTNCSLAVNATAAPIPTNPSNIFPLYRVSFMLYSVFAVVSAILIAILVSLLTGVRKNREVDPKLMVSLWDKCCCCFGNRCRRHCICGAQVNEQPDGKGDASEIKELEKDNEIFVIESGEKRAHEEKVSQLQNGTSTDVTHRQNGVTNHGFEKTRL